MEIENDQKPFLVSTNHMMKSLMKRAPPASKMPMVGNMQNYFADLQIGGQKFYKAEEST